MKNVVQLGGFRVSNHDKILAVDRFTAAFYLSYLCAYDEHWQETIRFKI